MTRIGPRERERQRESTNSSDHPFLNCSAPTSHLTFRAVPLIRHTGGQYENKECALYQMSNTHEVELSSGRAWISDVTSALLFRGLKTF